MVMTGSDGQLLVGLAGVGQVRFGEETNFTTSESGFTVESSSTNSSSDPSGVTRCNLHLGLHLGGHCHLFELLVGSMWASIQEVVGGSDVYETNIGSSCAVGIRGTEFTATAYGNGTSNVMVLNGLVEVQDLASNSTVSLQANQMVTVPNVSGGLSEQNMSQRVATVNPNSIDRWWETPLATTSTTLAPLQQLLQPTALEVGAVVVAVVVAAASVLYVRSRKGK